MTEDDLRSRLRRADPAASLAPLAPDEASRLLEETMTTTAPPRTTTNRPRRYAGLVAAALVLLAVAGAGWLLTRPGQPVIDAAKPSAVVVTVTTDGIMRKCVEPTAQILATDADFAFAGTVTGIAGDVVTLDVTQVYKGTKADEVRVAQAPGSSEQMLGSGQFEKGKKYLIASSDGGVLTCGYSGEADLVGLQELYDKAF